VRGRVGVGGAGGEAPHALERFLLSGIAERRGRVALAAAPARGKGGGAAAPGGGLLRMAQALLDTSGKAGWLDGAVLTSEGGEAESGIDETCEGVRRAPKIIEGDASVVVAAGDIEGRVVGGEEGTRAVVAS